MNVIETQTSNFLRKNLALLTRAYYKVLNYMNNNAIETRTFY